MEYCRVDHMPGGIRLSSCAWISIQKCAVFYNDDGIVLAATTDSNITGNAVFNNTNIGISVGGTCARNFIYDNQIGWNSINAVCMAGTNSWDNGIDTGNLWLDYSGEGAYYLDDIGVDNYPRLLTTIVIPVEPPDLTALVTTLALLTGVAATALVIVALEVKRRRAT